MWRHLPWAMKMLVAATVAILAANLLLLVLTHSLGAAGDALSAGGRSSGKASPEVGIVLLTESIAVSSALSVWLRASQVLSLLGTVISAAGLAYGVYLVRRRPAVVVDARTRFRATLDELIASLGELERSADAQQRALAQADAERRRNEALIALTREQAQELRGEIRDASAAGGRLQVALWVVGIFITLAIFYVQERHGGR